MLNYSPSCHNEGPKKLVHCGTQYQDKANTKNKTNTKINTKTKADTKTMTKQSQKILTNYK